MIDLMNLPTEQRAFEPDDWRARVFQPVTTRKRPKRPGKCKTCCRPISRGSTYCLKHRPRKNGRTAPREE